MGKEIKENAPTEVEELSDKLLQEFENKHPKVFKDQKKLRGAKVITHNIPYIYDMLVEGMPVTEICKKLGIGRRTWYYFKENSAHFTHLIEQANQEQIDVVKNSLVRKTQERYVPAERVLANGEIVKYNKYIPSDFNSIKFYLLNKCPDEYRDKHEVEIKKTNITVDIIDMPTE